jgi:peptidoglycan/xylan/chitin deacetylase (PgdA/CDA1 family)
MDVVAPTDSPEVAQWMTELEGVDIPDIPLTVHGDCSQSPQQALSAQTNGWWTCGGWTRDTDIVACPDKLTWGVSFDDGPGPYTQKLLNYLTEKDLKATFFVVGSRVISRPDVLVEEYMQGHEISVHTWAHFPLTSLTNEQIVAELGWTRQAIKQVLGVTPTTMRPPYGDIDDRVRAISLAMGLTPIIWTSTPSGIKFDTNDWRVAGGSVTGPQSFETFESILGNATTLDNGFIVLEHDLYEITVDLAVGYTLNAALTHNPPFTLEPIGQCSKIPTENMYMETTTNQTYLAARKLALSHANTPFTNSSGTGNSTDSNSGTSGTQAGVNKSGAERSYVAFSVLGMAIAAGLVLFI